LLVSAGAQTIFGQSSESGFYQPEMLRDDYQQVKAVVYVNVTGRKLIDFTGSGDCESDKGSGYCLYQLTARVKEVFKGKVTGKTLKFYTSPEAGSAKKKLMGEKVAFLNKGKVSGSRTKEFVTLENSSRENKFGIVGELRKIKRSTR
jgi:hypothetical protein